MNEKWKRDLFSTRRAGHCSCANAIPGVTRGRVDPACPAHGWEGEPDAEAGRGIVENDAIQAEHGAHGPFAAALQQARADRIPVMALRPDGRFPEEMDDVVVLDCKVHFEAMSNTCWWMACDFENGEQTVFHFTIGKNPKRIVVTCNGQPAEWRDWDVLYREARHA